MSARLGGFGLVVVMRVVLRHQLDRCRRLVLES
jgi:hypothetical protein